MSLQPNSNLYISRVKFYSNRGKNGGAISVGQNSLCWIKDCSFQYNVGENGGAIWADQGSTLFVLGNSRFDGNRARSNGGCVSLQATTTTFETVFGDGNTAGGNGGFLSATDSTVVMTNCQFDRNIASGAQSESNGGTIWLGGGNHDFSNVYVRESSASGTNSQGGSLFMSVGTVLHYVNCLFQQGTATLGGSVGLLGPGTVLTGKSNTHTLNSAKFGGSLYLTNYARVEIETDECTHNSATKGGCYYITSGSVLNSTSSFYAEAQVSESGGAFYVDSNSQFYLYRGTIMDNEADNGAGGILCSSSSLVFRVSFIKNNGETSSNLDCQSCTVDADEQSQCNCDNC